MDTIKEFAVAKGLEIELIDDFRERKVESNWIEDFTSFCKKTMGRF